MSLHPWFYSLSLTVFRPCSLVQPRSLAASQPHSPAALLPNGLIFHLTAILYLPSSQMFSNGHHLSLSSLDPGPNRKSLDDVFGSPIPVGRF